METAILSVGIDIGTSTTSMVVSRLFVENTASCFAAPSVAITKKEIVYRGKIYQTPQADGNHIDIDAVANILEKEYEEAKLTPDMVQTGAVIITGESSRKENAKLVTQRMSSLAGEFVVATAGPDLESIIAAKGAGAQQYSTEHACTVANFDIGGGTTNIAIFHCGNLIGKGCFDIGGRLIKVENQQLTYISDRLQCIKEELGIAMLLGDATNLEMVNKIADRMADILGEAIGSKEKTSLCDQMQTSGSSFLEKIEKIDFISFSGGVADYIYNPSTKWFCHGDIGPILGDCVRRSNWFQKMKVIPVAETIRATVVGAGSYTTTVSGSTISFSKEVSFPLQNIPVFTVSQELEQKVLRGDLEDYRKQVMWFFKESGVETILFSFTTIENPSYKELCSLADILTEVSQVLEEKQPLLVLTEHDFGKALGQALKRRVPQNRDVVCIDSVHVVSGDYIDFGRPLMDGLVIPVVVKTLIYG